MLIFYTIFTFPYIPKQQLIDIWEGNKNKDLKETLIENEITIQQELETNIIYKEDCIIGMKKIKNESVDIIICDPPYNIGKDFGNNSDKQNMDEYLLWCDIWIAECLRILKPKGTLYIYIYMVSVKFLLL